MLHVCCGTFVLLLKNNKGTRGVHASYDTVLPPFISIVWSPGRPVISVPDLFSSRILGRGVQSKTRSVQNRGAFVAPSPSPAKQETHVGSRWGGGGEEELRKTRPPTRVSGPFGPEVPPEVPERVSLKAGCAWECLRECSRDPLSPGPKCVQKVT